MKLREDLGVLQKFLKGRKQKSFVESPKRRKKMLHRPV